VAAVASSRTCGSAPLEAAELPGEELTIPALESGGLILSYRCPCECRHCLYRSSPRRPDEWMSLDMARRIFAALRREERLGPVHFSGGEPGLRLELLEAVIRLAAESGIGVSYVQTNGFWCEDAAETRRAMKRLKDAGLRQLYVSVSMFHNEGIPFRRSRICVEAAREVFGRAKVILWSPGRSDLYEVLSRMPGDGVRAFEEFERWARESGAGDVLPAVFKELIPRGRIAESLRDRYASRPADEFRGETCREELMSTRSSATIYHFHIDYYGNLVMGCCAGLSPATVDDLHPRITPASHPVFHRLCTAGPHELMLVAREEHGFRPRPEGYVSKCDLCFDVRRFLLGTGKFRELRPAFFYDA